MNNSFIGVRPHARSLRITDASTSSNTDNNTRIADGMPDHAADVIKQVCDSFKGQDGALMLSWLLGAHLKAYLGKWPHLLLAGKQTGWLGDLGVCMPIKQLSNGLDDEECRLNSVAATSFPAFWHGLRFTSARNQRDALRVLQSCYEPSTLLLIGKPVKSFYASAPVVLDDAQEGWHDVLTFCSVGLQCRFNVNKPLVGLPIFPMWQWLLYLSTFTQDQIAQMHLQHMRDLQVLNNQQAEPATIFAHEAEKYACLTLAWELLCDFAHLEVDESEVNNALFQQLFIKPAHS